MMYHEELMDHFKNPCNYGVVDDPDFIIEDDNPSCGDHISMSGKIIDDKLIVKFTGKGCVLSQATASMLTEKFNGQDFDKALSFGRDDMLQMLDLTLGPVRIKCAMLPLLVLQSGIKKVKND